MSVTRPPDLVDSVVGEREHTVQIADLDARFRLKLRPMVVASLACMYDEMVRHMDVAAMRGRGMGSVATFAEFERIDGPLAVGATLASRAETRHVELSGTGLGNPVSRVGFETRFLFTSPRGTGDPRRYREVVSPEPVPCGRGRVVLTMIRPFAPPARRLVAEPPEETRHLRLHVLDERHPSVGSLTRVAPDAAPLAEVTRDGVMGLQHTDTNQYVFTGEYLAIVEDHATLLAARAGLPVAEHRVDKVGLVFKSPLRAGDRYEVRGALHRDGERTVAVVAIHPVTDDGPAAQPAVAARVEGAC